MAEEERKTVVSMLGKLHILQSSSSEAVDAMRSLLDLVTEAVESKLATEASTRNVLNRFSVSLTKYISASAPSTEASGEVGSGSGSGNDDTVAGAEDDAMTVRAETPRPSEKQLPIQEEEEEEEDDGEGDTTTMTTTTAFAPDAEGTRFINMDELDELDQDDDATVLGRGERRQINDESLVDSLLESEGDIQ